MSNRRSSLSKPNADIRVPLCLSTDEHSVLELELFENDSKLVFFGLQILIENFNNNKKMRPDSIHRFSSSDMLGISNSGGNVDLGAGAGAGSVQASALTDPEGAINVTVRRGARKGTENRRSSAIY